MIEITLIDDHPMVRDGLRMLFEAEPDLTVVADAGTVADAIAVVRAVATDVVIMDVRLADGSGVLAARAIRSERPGLPVVMLTATYDHEAHFAAVMAGACGCVVKQVRDHGLLDTVRSAAAGRAALDAERTARALAQVRAASHGAEALTRPEQRVAELVADGLTNRQIGEQLGMAVNTVATRVASMLSNDRDRRAAVAGVLAERLGRRLPAKLD